MLGAYSGPIGIFVNVYDEEARYACFTLARVLMKITSISQTALSGSQHFLGIINYPLLLCNKRFDQNRPGALAIVRFSMIGLTILLYTSHVTNI